MISSKPAFRAVQLDLARQKENLEAIGDFIEWAGRWGYNALFLYLEGAVRTKTFPELPAEFACEKAEIKEILRLAEAAGLEVIPCVATLGHAEHFLGSEGLAHLRESGSWYTNMFCPSRRGTYEFLEGYLAEIAALFPSPNFHIGCDEAWALGCCPVCRERLRNGEKREDFFLAHIRNIHAFLGKLGKRVWIWSDMLETFAAEALEKIPKDIVLCEWHYRSERISHDGFQGHFNNLRRRDALALHAKSGHETVLCCGCEWSNVADMAEAGRNKGIYGGLLTIWELSTAFLPSRFPSVAFMGRLWTHPEETGSTATEVTLRGVFPGATEVERLILRHTLSHPLWGPIFWETAYRGKLTLEETRYLFSVLASARILEAYRDRLPPGMERDIVEELLLKAQMQACIGQARLALSKLGDPRNDATVCEEGKTEFLATIKGLDQLALARDRQWDRWRKGCHPNAASANIREFASRLNAFFDTLTGRAKSERGVLSLRLFLIEGYSAPWLSVEVFDGKEWVSIASRATFKPANLLNASFALEIPMCWKYGEPQILRITLSGYGGQGVQFASLFIDDHRWIPECILSIRGSVENAEALLSDDAFVCYLGEKDTLKTLEQITHEDESVIEIKLARLPSTAKE